MTDIDGVDHILAIHRMGETNAKILVEHDFGAFGDRVGQFHVQQHQVQVAVDHIDKTIVALFLVVKEDGTVGRLADIATAKEIFAAKGF